MSTQTRRIVLARAGGLSDLTGRPLDAVEIHHRRPGGKGGTLAAGQNSPANLVALRPEEHNMHQASVHMRPAWARSLGFILSHGRGAASIPHLVPVWWRGQGWAWLTTDGDVVLDGRVVASGQSG